MSTCKKRELWVIFRQIISFNGRLEKCLHFDICVTSSCLLNIFSLFFFLPTGSSRKPPGGRQTACEQSPTPLRWVFQRVGQLPSPGLTRSPRPGLPRHRPSRPAASAGAAPGFTRSKRRGEAEEEEEEGRLPACACLCACVRAWMCVFLQYLPRPGTYVRVSAPCVCVGGFSPHAPSGLPPVFGQEGGKVPDEWSPSRVSGSVPGSRVPGSARRRVGGGASRWSDKVSVVGVSAVSGRARRPG